MALDQFSGHGGSYVAGPDGVRRLVFRTGLGAVTPDPEPVKPKPGRRSQSDAPVEELSDGPVA
jgi:hypothetical protein